jgi:hypothetical protein
VGTCLLMAGLIDRLAGIFGQAGVCRAVLAGGLLCLALGSLLPHRIARLLVMGRAGAWPRRLEHSRDESLLWAVLAVVALSAGLAVAFLPLWASVVERSCRWVLAEFLWPGWGLAIVQVLAVVLLALPGLALVGVMLGCSCRLASPRNAWCISPLGCGTVGVGAGLGLLPWLGRLGLPADAILLVAAVPLLLAAVVSVLHLGDRSRAESAAVRSDPISVPDLRDRHPQLLWLSVAWLAATAAVVVAVWPQASGYWRDGPSAGGSVLPVLVQIVAAGVGVIVCERSGAARSHSAGGLGVAGVAAGVSVALAAVLAAMRVGGGSGGVALQSVVLSAGAGAGFAMGFALAYGHLAILRRVGHRVAGNASLLAMTFTGWAVAVFAVQGANSASPRSYILLAASAVSLVALGGATIVHEPGYSPRTRRRRLAGVVLSIVLMVCLLPLAGRRWTGPTDAERRASDRPAGHGDAGVRLSMGEEASARPAASTR